MWLALCTALLLLALGSKVASAAIRLVLLAVHRVGLLSNIPVDDHTTLHVTIRGVHIRVWRNVWKFVQSPTQSPLVTIDVSAVHLLVQIAAAGGDDSHKADAASSTPASLEAARTANAWATLDTGLSLKRLDHPVWKSVQRWLHRLQFACLLLPTVRVAVNGIDVDVVEQQYNGSSYVAAIQKGGAVVEFQYHLIAGVLDATLKLCSCEMATAELLGGAVKVSVRDVEFKMSVPLSRAPTDLRAPVPTSLHLQCGVLGCSLDLVEMQKGFARPPQAQMLGSAARGAPSKTASVAHAIVLAHRRLPLRLSELIPDVSIKFDHISVNVDNGVGSEMEGTLASLTCRVDDPSRCKRMERNRLDEAKEMIEERKVTVEVDCFVLSTGKLSSLSASSSIRVESAKIEADSTLMTLASPVCVQAHDDERHVQLSWNTRMSSEVRGLSVCLADDLAAWVVTAHASTHEKPPCCQKLGFSALGEEEDETQNEEQDKVQDKDQESGGLSEESPFDDLIAVEMQVQCKALRTEIVCSARQKKCQVLPKGVPDIGISVDEIVLLAHPFANDEPLGIRAKIDLQASRVKLFYAESDRLMRTSFVSIDVIRVLIESFYVLGSETVPAEIEMEAEWLEVRWTPEAMHSIGGMLELGVVVLAPMMKERFDWTSDKYWDPRAANRVLDRKTMAQVVEDEVTGSELIKFRCKVKRCLVLFSHNHNGKSHVDYVTVGALNMSVEESSGRFRLSILDTNIFNAEGVSDIRSSPSQPLSEHRKRSFRRQPSRAEAPTRPSTRRIPLPNSRNSQCRQQSGLDPYRNRECPYFSVKAFALEKNALHACPMAVLDLFVDGVEWRWTMVTQERVVELIRQTTFSSWEMLYRMRSAYGQHCTPPDSRYNRGGGLNSTANDLAECTHSERLLKKLISAGGETLNRIHATNIELNASFGDHEKPHEIKFHVGVFSSDDLPELWEFEHVGITIGGSLKLVGVDRVAVRHTVEKRRDYVFGFFEEALRLRQIECGRLPRDASRNDGMIIDIDGLRVGLSLQLDLVKVGDAIMRDVSPLVDSHMASFTKSWRPQHDVFYLYFLRIPHTPEQPNVWLQLSNIQLECLDRPMEAWLEHVYPVWMDELAEQELRTQLLEEQVSALQLTNADMLTSDHAAQEMNSLLLEKSSKIYAHKVKRLLSNHPHATSTSPFQCGSILLANVGFVSLDLSFEVNERAVTQRIRDLDEASAGVDRVIRSAGINPMAYGPAYSLLLHQRMDVSILDVSVRMRNFLTPVAIIEQVKVGGQVTIAAPRPPDGAITEFALTAALRCFLDLDVAIQRPVVFFGPAYIYTMLELTAIVEKMLPNVSLDVDKAHKSAPWDIVRRLVHGRLRLQVRDTALRLLAASNSFEGGDYLEVAIQRMGVRCRRGDGATADVDIERLAVKIEPDALVNIAEISSLTLHTKVKWGAKCDPTMHYIFPVEYRAYDTPKGDAVFVDFRKGGIWQNNGSKLDVAACLQTYSGDKCSVVISGKIAPKAPTETMTRRDIASRSAIVLYTKHVEWLIRFGRIYHNLPQFPIPSRRRRAKNVAAALPAPLATKSNAERFLRVFRGLTVEDFAIIGLDVALYHSEKSQVGVRACINDKILLSGSILATLSNEGSTDSNCRRKSPRNVSFEVSGRTFIVDDASFAVSDIQVRVCTPSTGSRGESLVSIRDVCLNIGGGGKESDRTHKPFDFVAMHSEFSRTDSSISTPTESHHEEASAVSKSTPSSFSTSHVSTAPTESSRIKSKKTILDHFAIAQHNPYHFSDDPERNAAGAKPAMSTGVDDPAEERRARSDSAYQIQVAFVNEFRRQGFLLGLSASEIRVLVTLDTVETMVDVVENWIRVVRASLPELYAVPAELLNQQAAAEASAGHVVNLDSPKKATSLADDPKFGAIFHASNPVPNNRTPSFNLDIATNNDATQSHQPPPSLSASVVEPFLTVRFMDCQINVQDHQHKGSMLVALNCGSLRHSRSQDIHHQLIDLKVDGFQVFTAPLDIDVRSRIIWLRTLENGLTYCPSSFGILKQVVAPIPTKLMIWVDSEISVTNRVDLCIPTVQIGINMDSKTILENLVLALMGVVTAKLAEYQTPDYSKMLQGFRGPASSSNVRSSLQQLVLAKKQLKWKIAELHWRHTCRWNYQVTERATLAMHAIEGVRSHPSLELETTPSPFLRPRRMSSASILSGTSLSLTGSTTTHVESVPDELQRLQQQLESIAEVLRSLVAAELLKRQPNPNVQLVFTLENASLTLTATNTDIVSAAMTHLKVKLKMYEDQSGTFALTIQDVACKNLCPNTPYPDLLVPLRNSKSWSGDEMFVRVDAEVSPPVGGITIVRHFEVNVHPMQVCLSYDLILQLVAFFTSVSVPTSRQEEKKAEIRSQFLTVPQSAGSGGDGILKKAAKVAGKAALPLTQGLGRNRVDGDSGQVVDPRVKAMQALQEEATQWISRVAQFEATKSTIGSHDESTSDADKEVNEMRDRAKNNILFKRIRLGTVEVMVSFKNKKGNPAAAAPQQPLEDMRGFEVKIHSLVYSDKTCSLMDLLLRIRRDVILDVLSQVGRNFTNVANFLRDQLDITRWAAFDTLAPLKSLSTAITGSSAHNPSAAPANAPASPASLSVEMLQRSPRISRDGASPAAPTMPVDTSKVFQLELPESHPSRRKKYAAHARPTEPTHKTEPAASTVSPMASPKSDPKDDHDTVTQTTSSGKPKKTLSSFFGKSSKKTHHTAPPAAAEPDDTPS